jgi:hypothetical protein
VGRDSSIGITNRYELDGRESKPGGDFLCRSDRPSGPTTLLCSRYQIFPEVKRPEHGADRPLHFSAGLLKGWIRSSAFPLCQHRQVMREL